jgi:hypothetical protein
MSALSPKHESRVRGLNSVALSAHIPEIDYDIYSRLEPPILLFSQTQENSARAHCDFLFQHQSALLVPETASTLDQFNNLVW